MVEGGHRGLTESRCGSRTVGLGETSSTSRKPGCRDPGHRQRNSQDERGRNRDEQQDSHRSKREDNRDRNRDQCFDDDVAQCIHVGART